MKDEAHYLAQNRETWNAKTAIHLASAFYNVPAFIAGKSSLNHIELALLGDVRNKKILHLQCHFGQDSISLSRMGAHVTGVDFSDVAIAEAQKLATACGTDTRFICCDVYNVSQILNETFDIVFTSYGTIGWLPKLHPWASVISKALHAGGHFVFVEFHPVVWMFDNDFSAISHNYFNTTAIVETEEGTYADRQANVNLTSITWNHPISEVVEALLAHSLQICSLAEYDYSPYPCFTNIEEQEPGKYRIAHLDNKIPMVYAISAVKANTL